MTHERKQALKLIQEQKDANCSLDEPSIHDASQFNTDSLDNPSKYKKQWEPTTV
jgi:hypothetical protein